MGDGSEDGGQIPQTRRDEREGVEDQRKGDVLVDRADGPSP